MNDPGASRKSSNVSYIYMSIMYILLQNPQQTKTLITY